jgi:hypothetical protein
MSIDSPSAVSLLDQLEPPADLPDECVARYKALSAPIELLAAFYSHPGAHLQPLEWLTSWHARLGRLMGEARTVLRQLHGKAPLTWAAGHAIDKAAWRVNAVLASAVLMLGPVSVPAGAPPMNPDPERRAAAYRARLGELGGCDWRPLLRDLAAAVTAERAVCIEPPRGEDVKPLNDTERAILKLCRRRAYKGETIAHEIGLSYGGHIRRVLSGLVKRGLLRVTEDGYRTVSRATAAQRRAT